MSKKITQVDPEVQAALNALWCGDACLKNVHTEMVNGHFRIRIEVEVEFGIETSQAMMGGLVQHVTEKIERMEP